MLLTIYDSHGHAVADIAAGDNSTQQKEIQGDNVLTLTFTHYGHIALDVNWYTDYEGERYWLTEKYAPKEKSEGEWEYDVKLYGIESLIKRFLVLETTDGNAEAVFTLTAPPRDHVAMIVKCINAGMGNSTDWKVGQVDGTELITIDYDGTYCDAALKEIAGKTGGTAEWWVEGQTVNVCRCEHGEEIALGYGKGLTAIERDTTSSAKFYTRLFPIGSTRNIDPERYGYSRLMLPGGKQYVEVHTDEYGIHDHYEKEAFSGIYPRRTGMVSSVRSEETTDEEGNTFTIYYFKDDALSFDPNDYELAEQTKRISFQDGDLAGLGTGDDHYFEVNFDSKTREFEIITIWPYDDDRQLPGGQLVPRTGDHYILWNIRMPDEYYPMAEEEFAAAVEEYNAEHWRDISVYKAPTDHVWVEENEADLYVGRRVRLESRKYFPETGYRTSRITKITRKVNVPGLMDIEISDALQRGALDKVNDNIGALKSYTKTMAEGAALPDIIRTGDKTRATDTNLYSARRSEREFVSMTRPNRIQGLKRFEDGIAVGKSDDGYGMTKDGKACVRTVESDTVVNKRDMSTKNLTVTGKLTVFELEIERAKSVGGLLIVSPADFRVDAMESIAGGWRCYMLAEEETAGGTPRKLRQMWQAGDQAFCQSVSLDSGAGGLRYYWRAVTGVSVANVVLSDGKEYLYIDLSASDCDTSSTDAPAVGDSLVLLGNHELRDSSGNIIAAADTARQGAEVLSAYKSVDPYLADKAPYKAQYWGIDDYDLTAHLKTYFARGKNHIVGDIAMTTESTVDGKPLGETLKGLEKNIEAAKAQSDRQIILWFGDETPTLANEPYTLWADDAERSEHVGDIYYNRSKTDETSGHAYDFKQDEESGAFYWDEITDSDVLYALELAAQARQDATVARNEADAAVRAIDAMADDNILTAPEKQRLGRELTNLWHERYGTENTAGLDADGRSTGVSTDKYDSAFDSLAMYLNGGTAWAGSEDIDGLLELPSLLSSPGDSAIDGKEFTDHWAYFYACRTELLNTMSNTHVRCFTGVPPQPPYKRGDIWVNATWPLRLVTADTELIYNNDTLTCIHDRQADEKFAIDDWQPQQEYTTKIIARQFQTQDKIASIICGEQSIDDIQSMIESASGWQGLAAGLVGLQENYNTSMKTINDTFSSIQKKVEDNKGEVLGYVRSNFLQYVKDDEGGLKLFASYLDEEGNEVHSAALTLTAFADGSKMMFDADNIIFSSDKTYINGHLVIDSEGNVSLDNLTVNNAVVNGEINATRGTLKNVQIGSGKTTGILVLDEDEAGNARIFHPGTDSGLVFHESYASLHLSKESLYNSYCDLSSDNLYICDEYNIGIFNTTQVSVGSVYSSLFEAKCETWADGKEVLKMKLKNLPSYSDASKWEVYVDDGYLKLRTEY